MYALEKLWKAYVFHAEGSLEADFRVCDRTLRMLFGEVGQMVKGHSSHHHQEGAAPLPLVREGRVARAQAARHEKNLRLAGQKAISGGG